MLCPLIWFTGETVCWEYFNKIFFFKYYVPIKYHQTDVCFFLISFIKEKKKNILKYLSNM